jgi:hypothetical protein
VFLEGRRRWWLVYVLCVSKRLWVCIYRARWTGLDERPRLMGERFARPSAKINLDPNKLVYDF